MPSTETLEKRGAKRDPAREPRSRKARKADGGSVLFQPERDRGFEDLRRLHEATLRVARLRDFTAALDEILGSAMEAVSANKALLSLCSEEREGLEPVVSRGLNPVYLQRVKTVPGGCGSAVKTKQRVIVEDVRVSNLGADFRNAAREAGFRACHSVPLVMRSGEVAGAITAYFAEPHVANEHEVWLMDLYAQMASDFVERFQAERRQRETEHQRNQLFQSLATPVFTCDAQGRITTFNEAAVELWGRRPDPEKDRWSGSHRIFQPDGTPVPCEESPTAIAVRTGKTSHGHEIVIQRPDGSRRAVLPHAEPLRDRNGRISGAVNTLVDITPLKERDLEIRGRHEQLRSIIDNTPECVKLTGPDGTVLDMNAAGLALVGAKSPDEVIGKPVFNLIAPEDRERFREMHQRVCSGQKEIFQFEITGLDGKRRCMETYATPLKDSVTGRVLHLAVTRDITERRRQESAVRLLAAIVESSDDAIASKTLDGTITSWNQGAERLFGYTASEAIGKNVTMLIPPERLSEEPAILARIGRGEPIAHYETIRVRKDGTRLNISLTVSPIRDETGRIVGASKIARDITARIKAETDLQRRTHVLEIINRTGAVLAAELNVEKLLQTVTDAATEATGAKFGAFFYTSTNQQGEKFILYTLSGAPREAFEKFGHPRATAIFGPTFRGEAIIRIGDVQKDPRYGQFAPHYGMPAGHLPVVSYLAAPVVSRSGEVLGGLFFGHPEANVFTEEAENILSGIAGQAAVALDNAKLYQALQRELLEHKKAEITLRQRESEFRQLAESLPQIVWTARPDGQVDYFNNRWYEFTGASVAFEDRTWTSVLHPDDVRRALDRWHHSVQSGEAYEIEYRFKDRLNGGYRWHLGRALPVRSEAGEIVKWVGSCTDIDDQKRAAERLELAVAERTASLKQAIAQMEEFSYSVSHDLRAPLRAVEGYSQVILTDFADELSAEVKHFLGKISQNVVRMQRLINDVLTLSRVARIDVRLDRVPVRQLLEEIIEQNPALQPPRAVIRIGEVADVLAHDVLLAQAISNLLNNAVKFVAPGVQPHVHIWTEKTGRTVRLVFQDNGIGIRPEHQSKLFGMFQRLSHGPEYEGTGIGLAIVRRSVERMGGAAGVESTGQNGSRFWIELREAPPVAD